MLFSDAELEKIRASARVVPAARSGGKEQVTPLLAACSGGKEQPTPPAAVALKEKRKEARSKQAAAARAYAAEHKCDLRTAFIAVSGIQPPASSAKPIDLASREGVAAARVYAKEHSCSLTEAFGALSRLAAQAEAAREREAKPPRFKATLNTAAGVKQAKELAEREGITLAAAFSKLALELTRKENA